MAEKSSRRETIEPNPGDKRYVRRNEQGEFTTAPSYQLGKAEEIVLVRVFYQYPVWLPLFGATFSDLPNGKRLLAAAAAFSNEPFRLPAASAAPTN